MKLKHLLLLGLSILVPVYAAAEEGAMSAGPAPKAHNAFYVNLGTSSPYSPTGFVNGWSTGYNIGAGYGFGLSANNSIVLDAHFNSFPINNTNFPTLKGGTIRSFLVLANGKFIFVNASNPVLFYAIVGLGPAFYSIDTVTGPGGSLAGLSETDLAFRLGLGIDIQLDPTLALTLESNGVSTSTSDALNGGEALTHSLFAIGLKFVN